MTLWLALDDVTAENGAMDMFTFNAVPEVLCLSLWTYYFGLCLIYFTNLLICLILVPGTKLAKTAAG